jgi:hypothetical protein
MKTRILWLIPLLIFVCIISGCSSKARYERRLKQELASGVRYDSLFMGLYLGMPQKDFYAQCWKLNRQGLIKQGSGNRTVEYVLKNELKYPGTMNFYPNFVQGKISEMPVRFAYKGWAPWNKKLYSDNLETDILKWYKMVYGGGFISVKHPLKGTAYIKVNGNRRISIYKEDDLHVWVVFTDMSVKENKNDTTSVAGKNHELFPKEFEKK